MEQRKRFAIASGAALLLALGGAAAVAAPALADAGPAGATHAVHAQAGHEDGTNDGETTDDANDPQDASDSHDATGSNDHEANEANETPGSETDDDAGQHAKPGHEGGTNDGETTDNACTGR